MSTSSRRLSAALDVMSGAALQSFADQRGVGRSEDACIVQGRAGRGIVVPPGDAGSARVGGEVFVNDLFLHCAARVDPALMMSIRASGV